MIIMESTEIPVANDQIRIHHYKDRISVSTPKFRQIIPVFISLNIEFDSFNVLFKLSLEKWQYSWIVFEI